MGRLTARQVATSKPGRIGDGEGLWLETSPTLKRRWLIRYSRPSGLGVTESALGSATYMTLAEAREAAYEFKRNLARGILPVRKATFGAVAADVLEARSARFKSGSQTARHWVKWLTYCKPLSDHDVGLLSVEEVLGVLKPLYRTKPAAANGVRSVMEAVFAAAKVRGLRSTDNPAIWRNNLDHVLAPRRKLVRGHHAAMAYGDVPEFMRALQDQGGVVSQALRFLVLTALRKNEVLGLKWSDVDSNLLTIPADRMKQGREHRVPLSPAAIAILEEQRALGVSGDLIFPSPYAEGKAINLSAINDMMGRMGIKATVHGFRSSFRDFAGDKTDAAAETAEACLAHSLGQVERAYRRGDALEKRRKLMVEWADFITSP
jgi:integrase